MLSQLALHEVLLICLAGFGAGAINAVVGSGSLITFPTLLALGYPPLIANISNTVGLVPGSLAGAWGYRAELRDQVDRLKQLGAIALVGALVGAVLLLVLPARVFEAVVPMLVGLAVVLVAVQPWLSARLQRGGRQVSGAQAPSARESSDLAANDAARPRGWTAGAVDRRRAPVHDSRVRSNGTARPIRPGDESPGAATGGWLFVSMVLLTGVYGGYFGAAQGVLLIAVLTIGLQESIQRANGLKNALAGLINLASGVVFALVATVDWTAAGCIAVGAAAGGLLGARVARRLPSWALRAVVIAVGLVALALLLR